MPKLSPIIDAINEHLKKTVFNTARFSGTQLHGLSEMQNREDGGDDKIIQVPCIVDNMGEGTPIFPDDTYPVIAYHRIAGTKINIDLKQQTGRSNDRLTRVAYCSLIIVALRDRIKLSIEDLDLIILGNMPDTIDSAALQKLALKSCTINVLGSDLSSQQVYQREWPQTGKLLSPEKMVLEIKYQIGCNFDKKCINQLCC